MERLRFHIINRKDHIIPYDVENMELYLGDNVSEKELRVLEKQKTDSLPPANDSNATKENRKERPIMHRITLCVSNDCNLRCRYCYADGGNYGRKRHLMDKNTADKFVDFCVRNFSRVDTLLFFGGEPLLNYPIIEYICELFKRQSANGTFPLPSFSIITNGTLWNERISRLIRDYISCMTISIDGEKTVNDKNRVYKNGDGSYDKVEQFILSCKEIPSLKLQFEATYTNEHVKLGISRFDVSNFLKTRFGIDCIVANEESLDKKIIYEDLCRVTKDDLLKTDFECLPDDFWQVVYNITKKAPHTFCGIFHDKITITTDGDIVGCQMMIGSDKSVIGHIDDTNALEKIKHQAVTFKHNPACKKCWCYALCGGCVVQKFYSRPKGCLQFLPNHDTCIWTRLYIEEILYLFFNIRKDETVWYSFVNKARTKYNS